MKGKVFTAQEVQAIILGNKTQFREVIRLPTRAWSNDQLQPYHAIDNDSVFGLEVKGMRYSFALDCPYRVGQKIFCKEIFYAEPNGIRYFSEMWDKERKWKPAQHMKQEHSRLTLQITEIRVERLADISVIDARDEGITDGGCGNCGESEFVCKCKIPEPLPIDAFIFKWNATHKKPEEKFEASPFVWVFSCEVVK